MSITEVKLSNFKSFHKASILLNKFNIIVGANASGKSNFIQFFKFIRDISEFGMDDAISMQGGSEYLFNMNHPMDNSLTGMIVDNTIREFFPHSEKGVGFKIFENSYELAIEFSDKKTFIKSVSDSIINKCEFFEYTQINKDKYESTSSLGLGSIVFSNNDGELSLDLRLPPGVKGDTLKDSFYQYRFLERLVKHKAVHLGKRQSIMEIDLPLFFPSIGFDFKRMLQSVSIFDIDPKLIKKAQPVTGRHDLESDGSNLAAVIRRLGKNSSTKRQMENIINDLLPFVEGISIKKLADNVIIRIKEKFKSNNLFPAFLLSDGTINLTALSIVLFFENKPLKIIEEPERNIHPHLISKIIDLMRDASEESQIITTTHNPEIVRNANIEELLLVSRNQVGDSRVTKPSEQEEISDFLRNNLGIEELYIQNILEKYSSKENA